MRTVLPIAAACLILTACGQGGGGESSAPAPAATDASSAPMDPAARAAALAALPAPYNAADIENGRIKFGLCRSCHSITPGGPNMTGPNLHGVFGRKAGTHEGFNYSEAVKAAGFTWGPQQLDQWLSDPRGFLPGNKMTFVGLKDPKDRTDLIAFLMVESGHKPEGSTQNGTTDTGPQP